MSDSTFQLIAIAVYLAAMLGIGYFAFKRTNNIDDYMLAGRGLKPGVAALSAGASDMSGWLLMGLPGAIYLNGLIEAWIAIGLTIGAWLNWKFVAPRLRSYTAVSQNAITIPSFFEKRLKDNSHFLRIAASVIILAFFTFYVSSGMVAAGKFFESSFGWNYFTGLFVVAAVTLVYTLFGGFLGATLTDVAQGLLMFAALIAVPIVAIFQMGNIEDIANKITTVNPDALNLFSSFNGSTNGFLAAVAIFSTAAWGLGYFGQPHIIVRFMALRSPSEAKTARRIGIGWMAMTAIGAIITALVGIAYFSDNPRVHFGVAEERPSPGPPARRGQLKALITEECGGLLRCAGHRRAEALEGHWRVRPLLLRDGRHRGVAPREVAQQVDEFVAVGGLQGA